jgi:hypothetical protein
MGVLSFGCWHLCVVIWVLSTGVLSFRVLSSGYIGLYGCVVIWVLAFVCCHLGVVNWGVVI